MATATAIPTGTVTLTPEQFNRLQAAVLQRTRRVTDHSTAEEATAAAWLSWCRAKPTIGDETELLRWLTVVARNEAYQQHRRDCRNGEACGEEVIDRASTRQTDDPHEHAELYDELHSTAQALDTLKPNEARALRLKAEGYSYADIGTKTGWTYTKVNRCLTEGRASLRARHAEEG